MTQHEEVKRRLYLMLEDMEFRLARITMDIKRSDEPLEKDFAEQGTQKENDEVLDYLGNAARSEIAQIRQAIKRIDEDKYGLCEVCDEPIGKERLEVLPYSTMCIKCASQAHR
ncbi:MAG: TraR/DksA family transcriptional regulator [Methylococcales bacterium]|nr:TraR/DksA family transcriptional regulator [Methylococcales bacterium]